jgi:hypothetical protein
LKIGIIFAFLKSVGKADVERLWLNICVSGFAITSAESFKRFAPMSSKPVALFES